MFGLIALAAAAAAPPSAPKVEVQPPTPAFDSAVLAAHNEEREKAGVAPLAWSADLARDATVWAATLAQTNSFEHAPEGKVPQGENLWMGTRKAFSAREMVGLWIEERQHYRPNRFPDVSTTENWLDVGHYTQLIWSRTKTVGCGLAANAESDFLVCRYSPPGNWIGEYAALPLPPDATGQKPMKK